MNQVLTLYKNALDRLPPVVEVADENQKRSAVSYVFNSLFGNPLISRSLNAKLDLMRDDGDINDVVSTLRNDIKLHYDAVKREVDEDQQYVQQPAPADDPALSPAQNLLNVLNMLGEEPTISRSKWMARIFIEKVNANPGAFSARIQNSLLPVIQQKLEVASNTDADMKNTLLSAPLNVGIKNELTRIVQQQQNAPDDVNMAMDGGRKRRRGKKTKKGKKSRRYTRRR